MNGSSSRPWMSRRFRLVLAGLAAVATAVVVGGQLSGSAPATPGSGILGAPVLFGNGVITDDFEMQTRLKVHHANIVANLKDPSNVFLQEITWGAAGGHTGWHTHPGPVFVLVVAGDTFPAGDPDAGSTFALYGADCSKRTYDVGEVAVDPGQGHVHIGRAAPNARVYAFYLDVPAGAPAPPFRNDVSAAPATCF
jgi:hypothetical protein